ncbi:MAG TPA: dipeptidase, partial [Paenibacillaceae bacterium]|nr:dipeptidase [Paenibacillaceae bacterium]
YHNMKKADVKVQTFAIYIPEKVNGSQRFSTALTMVDLFYEKIVKDQSYMVPILKADDLLKLKDSGKRGGLLSLEGADALEGSLEYLRILYRLGVRCLGLTWNFRNEAADGCGEKNAAGLSRFGRELIREANRLGIVLDVSHLAEPGFWEVAKRSSQPFIASHSNCRAICNHPRNLEDDQIRMLISKGGVIGLTFVPAFVSKKEQVTITDLIKHIEHLLDLGAEDHMAFGSDFDGIDQMIHRLENQGEYVHLREILLQHYTSTQVEKWFWGNWNRVYLDIIGNY